MNTYTDATNSTNYKCILCDTQFANCYTCLDNITCTKCFNNTFLRTDSKGCVRGLRKFFLN